MYNVSYNLNKYSTGSKLHHVTSHLATSQRLLTTLHASPSPVVHTPAIRSSFSRRTQHINLVHLPHPVHLLALNCPQQPHTITRITTNMLKQRWQQPGLQTWHVSGHRNVFFFFIINFHYTSVYFRSIYEWKDIHLESSLTLQVCFLSIVYIFNYTNQYFKVLCLRMETSGVAGKGYGGWG